MSESSRVPKSTSQSSKRPGTTRLESPQLPPRVVKKKKPVKHESQESTRERGPDEKPSEFLVPLILIGVGLAGTAATTIMLRPESVPFGLWVGIRMAIIVVSALLTYGALFVAAQALDTDYGYISTGALKVAAITLTQDWVGDLAERIPLPFIPWLIAAVTTYGLFMYFFEIDLHEAIASVIVVRLVHFVAIMLLFAAIIGAIMGGKSIDLSAPAAVIAPNEADVEADDEEAAGELPPGFPNMNN